MSMLENYVVYDEAALRPELEDYIANNTESFHLSGHISVDEVIESDIPALREGNFYTTIQEFTEHSYLHFLQQLSQRIPPTPITQETLFPLEKGRIGSWNVNSQPVPFTDTDFIVYSGLPAFAELADKDYTMNTFKAAGLHLTLDEILLLGAKTFQKKDYDRIKDTWTISREGKTLTRSIGGDMHGDLRVKSEDLTPYESFSPHAKPALVRPYDTSSTERLIAYHSTEPQLLQISLKYLQELKGEAYVQEVLPQLQARARTRYASGNYTIVDTDSSTSIFFADNFSLKQVPDKRGTHTLSRQHAKPYYAWMNENDELLFGRKDVAMTFYPEEAERLVEATLRQIYGGGGRTTPRTADSLVDFRLSREYNKLLNKTL